MHRIHTLALVFALMIGSVPADNLKDAFLRPSAESRPWVYWFWLNGNLTKEGMTADLEAMHRAGIGGVLIMEVDQGAPVGPVAFMSEQWRGLFKHMVGEAERLGIEVNMNNDAGWNGSGGPWVPLDKAMQRVVTSEVQIKNHSSFSGILPAPPAKGGHYRDIAVLAFPTPAEDANPAHRIKDLPAKAMAWERMHTGSLQTASAPVIPASSVVGKENVVDLTSKMDSSGRLTWDAPALSGPLDATWTVVRFGHTFTGAMSHPAPATGAGPECDKLSKEGVEANYRGMIGKLVQDVGPVGNKAFSATHVDSWEVGAQNWTPKMREEFVRCRGYDLLPFLPVLTGRMVGSPEITERFLRDLRQTVSDLLVENYIGHLRKLANADGLRLSMEAYSTPANDQDVANHIDEPICEFWWPSGGGFWWSVKAMSSVAHVNGLPVVGAEAFTAGNEERWQAHPATIKALGDRAFCEGVNRFIVHRYAMQPWTTGRWPGMTMGPWGIHYERSNTWWEDSKAWHTYVHRCQSMLRMGRFVADALVLQSEEPMQRFSGIAARGYDYDGISPQAFLRTVRVANGKIVLPSGMEYRVLVLPEGDTMSLPMLEKINSLVSDGATVIGTPPTMAPGLAGYPQADKAVQTSAARLWGTDGSSPPLAGKGRVIARKPPAEVLAEMGVAPDFTADRPLRFIHRAAEGTDIYFLSNQSPQTVEALCRFRVAGKTPEAWYPDSGKIEPISIFQESEGITRIPLRFDPSGSMFVVFRPVTPKPSTQIVALQRDGKELVDFQGKASESEVVGTFTMVAWVKPEAEIKLPNETNTGIAGTTMDRNDVLYPPPGHEVWKDGDAGVGFGVGRNGVCVFEHGAFYFPALLVHPAAITDWTHLAVVYRDGVPSLYLNGVLARRGLKSAMTPHPGIGVGHAREVAPFRGQTAGLRQFPQALPDEEIARLATEKPVVPVSIEAVPDHLAALEFGQPGTYSITTADGVKKSVEVPLLPGPLLLDGKWEATFAPGGGAPDRVVFEPLGSWSQHADPGVRHFSGSAVYRKSFDFQPPSITDSSLRPEIWLDLGGVGIMAAVKLNDRELGLLWKPPYRLNISQAVLTGTNTLEIRVINLPINRMIGDESLPEDSERKPDGTLQNWPVWLGKGEPSPTGRTTFTSWRLWKKDEPLKESGLLGPVHIGTSIRLQIANDR